MATIATTAEQFAMIVYTQLTNGRFGATEDHEGTAFTDDQIQLQVGNDSLWTTNPATPLWQTAQSVVRGIVEGTPESGYATLGRIVGSVPNPATPHGVNDEIPGSKYQSHQVWLENIAMQVIVGIIDHQITERRRARQPQVA